jgi:hypothetical protein
MSCRSHNSEMVLHWSPLDYIFLKSVHTGSFLDGYEEPEMLVCNCVEFNNVLAY